MDAGWILNSESNLMNETHYIQSRCHIKLESSHSDKMAETSYYCSFNSKFLTTELRINVKSKKMYIHLGYVGGNIEQIY